MSCDFIVVNVIIKCDCVWFAGFNSRTTSTAIWVEPNLHIYRWYIGVCEPIHEPWDVHTFGKISACYIPIQ